MDLSRSRFSEWLAQPLLESDLKEELLEMADSPQKIEAAFGCELQFGTGGLRGILGAGTHRLNIPVVRRAAQATAGGVDGDGLPRRAAIGYDSRSGSERVALCFCGCGRDCGFAGVGLCERGRFGGDSRGYGRANAVVERCGCRGVDLGLRSRGGVCAAVGGRDACLFRQHGKMGIDLRYRGV